MGNMVDLCCPFCHGELSKKAPEDERLNCYRCSLSFSTSDGLVNLVDPSRLDEAARWQQAIYEGRESSQYKAEYLDLEVVRRSADIQLEIAVNYGLPMPNWKGLKSREILDKLKPQAGELVLDVGCGAGHLLNAMHVIYGTKGVGIDFSTAAIRAAMGNNPFGNQYLVADALNLPFRDGVFDLVISYDVIEHVPDHRRFAREMTRVLKPQGGLLIYTPSRRDRWSWHWWQRKLSGGRYNLGLDNLAGHDPEKFLSPEELAEHLEKAGLWGVKTLAFHTLYTLIFDETFPEFIFRLLPRPRLLKGFFRMLELADAAPGDRGYGNGFFAYGRRAAVEPVREPTGDGAYVARFRPPDQGGEGD